MLQPPALPEFDCITNLNHATLDSVVRNADKARKGITWLVCVHVPWASDCQDFMPHFAELALCFSSETRRFAKVDVMRWPESAVDFEAILGLDLLVRARAMIDISGSQVDLTNHAGESTTVRLEYPEESDAFEKVKADIAGKRASKAADASAAAASQAKEANASRTDEVSVAEAFAANAARMAELGTDPAAMSNRQIKAELKSRGVDASSAIERSDLLALIRDARARANLAPTITPPAA